MPTSLKNAKRSSSIRDTAAERWSRLYVDVRASYGRASIQSALLLNGGASVALLAFLGNLAIAHQTSGLTGNFVAFKGAFLCFGIGVMLAASSSVVAFLIQNVAIAHLKGAESNTGRLRAIGIGMVVAALASFAVRNNGGSERDEQSDRVIGFALRDNLTAKVLPGNPPSRK